MKTLNWMVALAAVAATSCIGTPSQAQVFGRTGGGIYSAFPTFYPSTYLAPSPYGRGNGPYGGGFRLYTYPAQVGPYAPYVPSAPNNYDQPTPSAEGTDQGVVATTPAGATAGSTRVPPSATTRAVAPAATGSFDVSFDAKNQLVVRYSGDQSNIASITVSLLDKDKEPITQAMITGAPAQGKFTVTSKTTSYRVLVRYVNGSTMSFTTPL